MKAHEPGSLIGMLYDGRPARTDQKSACTAGARTVAMKQMHWNGENAGRTQVAGLLRCARVP